MTATGKIMDGTAILGAASDWNGASSPLVEMRLQFDGYDQSGGQIEGRSEAGDTLFAMDIRQVLGAVPCFTATSQIATGQGPMPVSALVPGTRVITRDNGMQELLWVGRRRFGWQALGLNPLLCPVRIAAGALGQGLPERDMIVSPNHRFLTRMPGEGETGERLTMARDLVGLDGIALAPVVEVEYWQLLFARHELVLADGSWSESFLPTQASLEALDRDGRAALSLALPGIEAEVTTGFHAVRPFAEIGSAA
ncbi:Hint domain-containing protein [Rhodobacter capsulatus]|uniref:Hint domain-containing protein n=1 Tax=Rhodobacter capsulatus TaxID=1061 RepID=UPI00402700E4